MIEYKGAPANTPGLVSYECELDLKLLTDTTVKVPLFCIQPGQKVIAAKAVYTDGVTGANGHSIDIGTYKIADGAIGAVVDADCLFAAVTTDNAVSGTVVAPATTAYVQPTEPNVVVAAAKAVTTSAPTGGKLFIRIVVA